MLSFEKERANNKDTQQALYYLKALLCKMPKERSGESAFVQGQSGQEVDMTCGQRVNHRTHHHQGDPVVMMRVVVKLTLKVGDVAYPWVFRSRSEAVAIAGSVLHWPLCNLKLCNQRHGPDRSGGDGGGCIATVQGTALQPLHAIDLYRISV